MGYNSTAVGYIMYSINGMLFNTSSAILRCNQFTGLTTSWNKKNFNKYVDKKTNGHHECDIYPLKDNSLSVEWEWKYSTYETMN